MAVVRIGSISYEDFDDQPFVTMDSSPLEVTIRFQDNITEPEFFRPSPGQAKLSLKEEIELDEEKQQNDRVICSEGI